MGGKGAWQEGVGRDCCNCGIVVGTREGAGKEGEEKEVGVAGRSGKGELWDSSGDRGCGVVCVLYYIVFTWCHKSLVLA